MIDLSIQHRFGRFALDVRFATDARVVGLFGRSGAGKTTIVNAMAGVLHPQRGHIHVDGVTLFDSERRIDVLPEARRVGYVFQDALLFPHMSVEQNLLFGYHLQPVSTRFIQPARVVELLGLAALLHRKPATLSGGEKQRVAIGRALLSQPRILLLDEPLAALDRPRKTEILDYIERLRDELRIPIVYVSHSVAEISRLADAVVLLSDGKCLAVGEAGAVMSRLDLKPYTGRFEAGALIEAVVASHDTAHALTTLHFSGGELIVPQVAAVVGDHVRARVRARDVSLSTIRPVGLSILNVLPSTVIAVNEETGPVVDVQLAVGSATLIARITRRSIQQLGIQAGQPVYALIKAVSFDRRSVG